MKYKIKELIREPTDSTLYSILRTRGIVNPYKYLHPEETDIIDPSSIMNIREGAQCLIKHVNSQHHIHVNVDADCDGYTSAAFFINWMYRVFPGFSTKHLTWAFHDDKDHGIIEDKIPSNTKLLVVPDASSNEYDIHRKLKTKGIDILVIDHHNADKISEDAIVINNQLDPNYTTKTISGVMMVYKFCSYLDSLLGTNHATNMLDLAALGDIADVMDLRNQEAHTLITIGLANINNPFISAMIAKDDFHFKGKANPFNVSWYIAPLVNAVTRIGTIKEKTLLFDAMLECKAYDMIPSTKRGHAGELETVVEQAVRMCATVKRHQDKERDEMFEKVCAQIDKEGLAKNKIIIVKLAKEDSNTAITGLIANKLMSKYGHPIMLLNQTFDEETGEVLWAGSGRSIPTEEMPSLQQFAQDSGYFSLAQGHNNALGLAILDSSVDPFIIYSNAKLSNVDFDPTYDVDIVYPVGKIDTNDILEIADAEDIWGQGVEEPLVMLQNIPMTRENIQLFGSTLKFTLPDNLNAVKFKATEEEYKKLLPPSGDMVTVVNIIGTCSRNTGWDNGPQIIIKDYEIVNSVYYF